MTVRGRFVRQENPPVHSTEWNMRVSPAMLPPAPPPPPRPPPPPARATVRRVLSTKPQHLRHIHRLGLCAPASPPEDTPVSPGGVGGGEGVQAGRFAFNAPRRRFSGLPPDTAPARSRPPRHRAATATPPHRPGPGGRRPAHLVAGATRPGPWASGPGASCT